VGAWLAPADGRTPAVVVSVAHLDDDDRALVLGLLLDEVLAWVRGLPGTSGLRALVVFDEVYGFLPPHPASPPTKRPLVTLLKQARAYGVGVVVATQNPMDLDYRALSNAGMWFVGRLQTDADRNRVVEGMATDGARGPSRAELSSTVKKLAKRWFVLRDVHAPGGTVLAQPRFAITWMRGPFTRVELVDGEILQEFDHRRDSVGVDAVLGLFEAQHRRTLGVLLQDRERQEAQRAVGQRAREVLAALQVGEDDRQQLALLVLVDAQRPARSRTAR
jgi:hypothetical protein